VCISNYYDTLFYFDHLWLGYPQGTNWIGFCRNSSIIRSTQELMDL
jgi:hypothetical protein